MDACLLVADDSPAIQKVMARFLGEGSGISLVSAMNYREACSLARLKRPSAIVVDPHLNGAEGLEDLKKLIGISDCPALLIYGTYDEVDRGEYSAVGFSSFLKKPFDRESLHRVLEELGLSPQVAAKPDPEAFEMPRPEDVEEPFASDSPEIHLPPGLLETKGPGVRITRAASDQEKESTEMNSIEALTPTPLIDPKQWQRQLREQVEDYCRDHFKEMAKEILTEELRRLAGEKTKTMSP